MAVDVAHMLGRERESRVVAELVRDADDGHARVVLVTGEAGIGKTTLAEAAADLAADRQFAVAWGRCVASDMPAFWPWRQVLRAVLGSPEPLDPERFSSRPQHFSAVVEALERGSTSAGLLVIIEDLHWADPGTLALLGFVAGSMTGQRIVLLGSSRDGVDAVAGPAVRRIELGGLDREASRELVAQVAGSVPADDELDTLHRRTSGNPFFLREVTQLQVGRGSAHLDVPVGVRQVLERRLARLPHASFELLQLASVIGTPDVELLAAATGSRAEDVADLLTAAEEMGIVMRGRFVHDLMRETIEAGLGPRQRARLHRQAAEHLPPGNPADLARHWRQASGEDAPTRAADCLVAAGEQAMADLSPEQAVEHFQAAVSLGRDDLPLRRQLGEAQVLAGHLHAGRDALRAVARQARAEGAAEELALAVLGMGGGLGGFEVDIFDREQAELLDAALELLPPADSGLRAAVMARLSLARAPGFPATHRADLAQQAAEMARRAGADRVEVAALAAWCDACSGPEHVQPRLKATSRMLDLAGDDPLLELLARRMRLRARAELGDFVGVESDLAAYARISDRLRSPSFGWYVPLWRGLLAINAGDLPAARELCDEVERLGRAAQSDNALIMALGQRWRIAQLSGERAVMPTLAAAVAQWSDDFPAWDCSYALIFAETGQPDRARWHLRRLLESGGLTAVPFDSEWLELLWHLGEAAILLDEPEVAHDVAEALRPFAALWAIDGVGASAIGQVGELVGRLDQFVGREEAPAAAARLGLGEPGAAAAEDDRRPGAPCVLARRGATWELGFRGRTGVVLDSKGMHDIAVLLARPGQPTHVLDLVESAGGPRRAQAGADTGPVLDATARQAYQQRLRDLEAELDEAGADNDRGRVDRLLAEQEFLLAELSAALGLGGRPRISGDPVERARKAVTQRITTALRSIAAVHPDLARHLRNSIATGRWCTYHPEEELRWEIRTTAG